MRESTSKFAMVNSDIPTSLILIPKASRGPFSLRTRTEVFSSWRLRRRRSGPKLRFRNMGGGSNYKVAHPFRLNKITKVHPYLDRGGAGLPTRANLNSLGGFLREPLCPLWLKVLKALTTKVTKVR